MTRRGLLALVALLLLAGPARGAAIVAELPVRELGTGHGFTIRLFHDPDLVVGPAVPGDLFLVVADGGYGDRAFFLPTDLALEVAGRRVYGVEYEQASDLFGTALGGRVRPGGVQVGFVVVPRALGIGQFRETHPDSIVMRYAHQRTAFRPAGEEEAAEWRGLVEPERLVQALNTWWAWLRVIDQTPPMTDGEARLFAERLFPGQGEVLLRSGIPADALRNAILRVGERRLVQSPVTQRVIPRYPLAARQAGAEGLVVALVYVSDTGEVEDAQVIASNTVHLLNYAAVEATLDWRFAAARDEQGNRTDGWRLVPLEFRLGEAEPEPVADASTEGYEPPVVLKREAPDYPEKAYRGRVEGTVIYQVTLSPQGRILQTVLVQPVHPLLDAAALSAVEKSLYAPATRDGVPVEGTLTVSYAFPEDARPF